MGITDKIQPQDDDSKWEETIEDMISECEQELAEEAKERAAKGLIGLMHPMFTIQRMRLVPLKLKQK